MLLLRAVNYTRKDGKDRKEFFRGALTFRRRRTNLLLSVSYRDATRGGNYETSAACRFRFDDRRRTGACYAGADRSRPRHGQSAADREGQHGPHGEGTLAEMLRHQCSFQERLRRGRALLRRTSHASSRYQVVCAAARRRLRQDSRRQAHSILTPRSRCFRQHTAAAPRSRRKPGSDYASNTIRQRSIHAPRWRGWRSIPKTTWVADRRSAVWRPSDAIFPYRCTVSVSRSAARKAWTKHISIASGRSPSALSLILCRSTSPGVSAARPTSPTCCPCR